MEFTQFMAQVNLNIIENIFYMKYEIEIAKSGKILAGADDTKHHKIPKYTIKFHK